MYQTITNNVNQKILVEYKIDNSKKFTIFVIPNEGNDSKYISLIKNIFYNNSSFLIFKNVKNQVKKDELLIQILESWHWFSSNLKETNNVIVCGHKFGGWMCMQLLMRRPEFKYFIILDPKDDVYDYTFLTPCPRPGLVIRTYKTESKIPMLRKISTSNSKYTKEEYIYEFENIKPFLKKHIKNLNFL